MIGKFSTLLCCMMLLNLGGIVNSVHGQEAKPLLPLGSRTPQFPIKTKRMIYSDADIANARANIGKYPSAKAVAQSVIKSADYWEQWSDEALRDIIATA